MKNSSSEYEDVLSFNRDLVKELGSLLAHLDENLGDGFELNVDGTSISIWSIYEVILAIHFNSKSKVNRINFFGRLAKYRFHNRYESLRRLLTPKVQKEIKNEYRSNIIFLGFTGYLAFENFDLIFKNIIEDGFYEPLWVDDKQTDYYKFGNNRININEILSDEILSKKCKIEHDIKILIQKLIKSIKSADIAREKSDLLLSMIDFMRPEMETRIPKYLAAAIHILKIVKPSAIISIDVADPRNRVFTLLANKLSVPVIQVQAGNINQECIEWSFCSDDLMLSHGPQTKPQLAKLGFDISRVVETGSAKLEKVKNTSLCEEISLNSRFMIDRSVSVLLFLTSYVDLFETQVELSNQKRLYNEIYFAVVSEVSKKKNLSLVIKPHPLEKPKQLAYHNEIASKYKNIFVADKLDNTSEMIVASDGVISYGSTASLDALVLGKPVICPKFEDFLLNEYFNKSDAVLIPKDAKELSNILDIISSGNIARIIDDCAEGRKTFLEDRTNLNTSASKAIVTSIFGVIRDLDYESRSI